MSPVLRDGCRVGKDCADVSSSIVRRAGKVGWEDSSVFIVVDPS